MSKNSLYIGKVFHARHRPFAHAFTYRVFTLWANLDDIAENRLGLRFFGVNRWNILGFYTRDHGPRDGTALRPWIESAARAHNIDLTDGVIMFLGFPRLWGFVFNPLSLFFCYDRDKRLKAILYQVKNTFGEQHGYFLPVHSTPAEGKISQDCKKVFHVSPFIQMDCTYHFRLSEPDETLDVAIHQFQPDGKILTATWDGVATPLTDRQILRVVATHPLMTIKVLFAIHWQALRLWLKGARYIRRPPLPEHDIT